MVGRLSAVVCIKHIDFSSFLDVNMIGQGPLLAIHTKF